ncbi:MAG: hypothetical protein ACTHQE_17830 [Thermomicrobiales bacterium]
MSERTQGTDGDEEALAPQAGASEPVEPTPGDESPASVTSMLHLSPKWQMVLIGGVFIAINIMVMVIFVVVLFLRH